jgi:crossover junction endodeoxyribonuclease RuvC
LKRLVKNRAKVILGIDPGSLICGYGIIQTAFSAGYFIPKTSPCGSRYIASGRIILSSKSPLHSRLKELSDGLGEIIKEHSPDEAAVEKVFFAKGIKSALTLGHARGAVLVAVASREIPLFEYTALEVKKSIVGYGRAEKHQVQEMVSRILDLKSKLSKDSADALAIALCHAHTQRFHK